MALNLIKTPLQAIPANAPFFKHRLGGWMPESPELFRQWLDDTVKHIRKNERAVEECHKSIQQFHQLIEENLDVRMLFSMMFAQVPLKRPYIKDPIGQLSIRSWKEMLQVFNHLLSQGPKWLYNTEGQKGLLGFPFNAVLDWPMATPAGVSAFLRKDVNECFKAMLEEYGSFLASPASASVLTSDEDGWFSEPALRVMGDVASQGYGPISFEEAFVCKPTEPHYGYTSWDDFFTRKFRDGVRPVNEPSNNSIITNACESTPYRFQKNAKLRADFWMKGQRYSLGDMLGASEYTSLFEGGTVYQAFLSALSYHCWHAPISGEVLETKYIPGSYYAENYWQGFANVDASGVTAPDPSGPNNSQAYIAQVATRAVMFVRADDERLGVVAIVMVGMAEVSSCEWTVSKGDTINKGDPIGSFHFGGSTHCLVWEPHVNLNFFAEPPYTGDETNLPVNGKLAEIV